MGVSFWMRKIKRRDPKRDLMTIMFFCTSTKGLTESYINFKKMSISETAFLATKTALFGAKKAFFFREFFYLILYRLIGTLLAEIRFKRPENHWIESDMTACGSDGKQK